MEANSNYVPLECAVCGFSLGTGFPGQGYCTRCGEYAGTRASRNDVGGVIGALALLGLGLLAAYLISRG